MVYAKGVILGPRSRSQGPAAYPRIIGHHPCGIPSNNWVKLTQKKIEYSFPSTHGEKYSVFLKDKLDKMPPIVGLGPRALGGHFIRFIFEKN